MTNSVTTHTSASHKAPPAARLGCPDIVVIETAVAPHSVTVVYESRQWLPDFIAHRFRLPSTDAEC
jgi:hypothetical protein